MEPIHPMPSHDERRRRAIYRAEHRGTKELDLLLGRFTNDLLAGEIIGRTQPFTEEQRLAIVEGLIAVTSLICDRVSSVLLIHPPPLGRSV